jgi:type 1 glutamine amidotransferase
MNDTENEITQLQDYITSYALDNDITISCEEVVPRKTYTPVDENVWKLRIEAVRSKYGFVNGFNYDH